MGNPTTICSQGGRLAWAFGDKPLQLGDGTTISRDEPIQIVSSNVVLASVVGPFQNGSSFFIKTDVHSGRWARISKAN